MSLPARQLSVALTATILLLFTAIPSAHAQTPILRLESPSEGGGGHFGFSVAVVPDADGDGTSDLLAGSNGETVGETPEAGRAHLFSGATGALLHTVSYPKAISNSNYAAEVSGLPDIDDDGRGDFAIGGTGTVYVYSGATGALLHEWNTPLQGGLQLGFGYALAGVPDVDDDERGDLLIGAYRHDVGAAQTGVAYLFSGGSGDVIHTLRSPAVHANGYFGTSVATVPDADGDGMIDLLVGARNERVGALTPGQAHLFSGATGAHLFIVTSPNPEGTGDFASTVAGVPDVDGDGRGDLLIGAVAEDGGASNAGRAYLFSGATGVLLHTLLSPTPEALGNFGRSVAGVPDVNGDGRGDLLIGAAAESGTESDAGRAYLFSGATGTLLETFQSPTPRSASNGHGFGYDVAGVPDVDGDGLGDLFVGAPQETGGPGGTPGGRAYLFVEAVTTAVTPALDTLPLALTAAPNPAREQTTLIFTLERPASVRLVLFDALGREVAVLADGAHAAGKHAAPLDTRRLAPGVYAARLVAGEIRVTRMISVVR